ncbi:MAG: M14 family zinc carboxypeptidase, partial [Elusimicrobiota bacterium]
KGPAGFSEPESSAVRDFVSANPNVKVLLSYHTFSELILYPWGHSNSPVDNPKDRETFKKLAETMAQWNGYTPEQSSDLYIASGDTTDWSWGAKKIFSFTFELTPASMWAGGFYPGAGVIDSTFQKNIAPALYLIDLADDPYRAGGGAGALAGSHEPAAVSK